MKTAYSLQNIKAVPLLAAIAFTLSILAATFMLTTKANAVLEEVMVRFDNIEVSTATTGTVCANPQTVATEASVHVTFPTSYTVSGTAGDHTVNTTNLAWPSGAQAWPGIATATTVSGQEVTFPSDELTVDTLYCFNWTGGSAVTTQASPSSTNTGSVATYTSGPALIESTAYVTPTVSDDDIVVTATVPQSFSFALSANTDALGNLATGSVTESPTPRTVTINTNAQFGWMVWAREDATAGLRSTSAGYSIDSASAGTATSLSAGTEGYITGVSDSQVGGTGTIALGAFDYDDVTNDGAPLDNTLRTIASSDGTADTAVLTLRNQVAIAGTTPAATDYTDTITVTGAGMF